MIVSIHKDHLGEFGVWVALQPGDPIVQPESFCIGVGSDAAEAFASARRTMAQAFDDLVVLAHEHGVVVQR